MSSSILTLSLSKGENQAPRYPIRARQHAPAAL